MKLAKNMQHVRDLKTTTEATIMPRTSFLWCNLFANLVGFTPPPAILMSIWWIWSAKSASEGKLVSPQ